MNSAKLLYTLLNVLFILILCSIGISILFAILIAVGIEPTSITTGSEIRHHLDDPILYVFGGLLLLVYGIFCFGIWNLRKAASIFLNENFYTAAVIKTLALAGKSFVLTGIFAWLVDGLSGIYFKGEISLSLSDKTFTYLFITSVGLFMMLMSTVIKDAKNLKNENDLTI